MARVELSFDYKKIGLDVLGFIQKFRVVITAVVILAIFAYALLRINSYAEPAPNQSRIDEQVSTFKKVNINDETVRQVQELVESNVQIDPNFDNRENPFAE